MKTFASVVFPIVIAINASSVAQADRLPVDLKTRTVTEDHILLEVSDTQAEEMDTQDTLTLTTDQWQLLRKKGLLWPMRLEWIVNYDDDTCGCALMGFTGIRLDEKRVAIVPGYSEVDNIQQALAAASDRVNDSRRISLRVDRKGQFYAKGILVPYRDLLSYFEKPAALGNDTKKPSLSVRFPVGVNRHSTAVKERVNQLEAAAKSSGWEVDVEKRIGETTPDN